MVEERTRDFEIRRKWKDIVGALVAVACATVVYGPIVLNFFHADDFQTLQQLANFPVLRFVLTPGGGHIYLLRNVAYEIFYRTFGTDTSLHFGAVLLTHLLNVVLLFVVLRRLDAGVPLACFGATLWGAGSVHSETLGWYAVYGHVLVATLVLVVLGRLAGQLRDPAQPTAREALVWMTLLLLASVTFGVGVGVALVFPVVLFLFPESRTTRSARALLAALPALVVGVYWLWHRLYLERYGGDATPPALLFEFMIGWWQATAAMVGHLLAAGAAWLLGGFALPSDTYPTRAGYVLAAALAALVFFTASRAPTPTRRLLFVFVLLAIGAYTIIAAGRAGLLRNFSVVFGADMSRYHYVPTLFLTLTLCLTLGWLGSVLRIGSMAATVLLAVWLVTTAVVYGLSDWQIDHYADDRQAVEAVLQRIRAAVENTPRSRPVVLENHGFRPALLPQYFAGWAGLYTIYFPDGLGRPVYFVTHDRVVYAQAVQGSRLAAILVLTDPLDE